MEMKKESKVLTDGIHELIKGKLIHQFRKDKWEGIIEEQIKTLVDVSMKAVVISTANETIKECNRKSDKVVREVKENFKDFVKKPKATFTNRIKFLFLGGF